MILKKVILKNFRCYKDETIIEIDDFTAFLVEMMLGNQLF